MYKILISILLFAGTMMLLPVRAYTQDSAASKIEIVDAKLGKNVQDRVLVDEGTTFPANSKVYLWLRIKGGASESITVTWQKTVENGKSAAVSTKLAINGSPWRTWASKTVGKAGDWTVTVADEAGNTLKTLEFKVE